VGQKTVVFVARDAAPSGCFKLLEPVLKDCGFGVTLFTGGGRPLAEQPHEITSAIRGAGVVVLGMSSSAELAQPEIAAGQVAREAEVPFGFYGDVSGCWVRAKNPAWFWGLAVDAAFYCGVTQQDADAAKQVFPNAKLIGTGNPLREEMAFPNFTRDRSH